MRKQQAHSQRQITPPDPVDSDSVRDTEERDSVCICDDDSVSVLGAWSSELEEEEEEERFF